MAERDSTIIEQMLEAFDSEERSSRPDRMAKAVREMVAAIQHRTNYVGMTCQLLDLLEEDERVRWPTLRQPQFRR